MQKWGDRVFKKLLLVVNPVAGKKKIRNFLFDIVEIFGKGGYSTTVMTTGRRGDAIDFMEFGHEYDLIVCCGGDGTLNEVINGIITHKVTTPLGYIPCGSTNDFANSMGLSLNVKKAAESIVMGKPLPLDIGEFDDKYFTYVASFGAFTAASYSTSQDAKNVFGYAAYLLEGIKDLSSIKPYHMKLISGDAVYEGDYVFGAVANSRSFGGVIKLKEDLVSLNDGLFEVLLIKMPKDIGEIGAIIAALTSSNFENNPRFEFFKSSKLTLCPPGAMSWSLDGEHVRTDGDVVVTNLHGEIEFLR